MPLSFLSGGVVPLPIDASRAGHRFVQPGHSVFPVYSHSRFAGTWRHCSWSILVHDLVVEALAGEKVGLGRCGC